MFRRALLILAVIPAAACQPPGAGTPTTRAAPLAQQYTLLDLIGGWRWVLRANEAGTSRIEDERWRLRSDPAQPMKLLGRYVRSVEVRSLDGLPFQCNQRPWYRQRAVYDLTIELGDHGFVAHESSYTTEPSPCDHGFRHMSDYEALPAGNRLAMKWDGGSQYLWQTDDTMAPLPEPPWPKKFEPIGPWRWVARSYDDDGNIRDETEWWEITRRTDTRLDITYRRRVNVHSPDGKPIACAGAPFWSFDDAYVLDGQKEEEHWHLYELAVEPGDHACLRATPKRNLDEATAEQIGDYFILEWRGKRHQILYRPDESTPQELH
ncbi:MAG: hypothetical protein JWO36_711 [Myxococcales bacterium]|nr:hypothetical protein [Myxococcales bacterium]